MLTSGPRTLIRQRAIARRVSWFMSDLYRETAATWGGVDIEATCPEGYVLRVTSHAAPAAGGLPAPPPPRRPRASASTGPAPRGARVVSPRARPPPPTRRAEDRHSRSSHAARARPASARVPAIDEPSAARPYLPPAAAAAAAAAVRRSPRPAPRRANSHAPGILAARVRRPRSAGTHIAGSPPVPHRPGYASRNRGHAAFPRSAGTGPVGSPPGPSAAPRAAPDPRRQRRSPCHPSRSTGNPARSILALAAGTGRGVVPLDLLSDSHLRLSTRPRRFPNLQSSPLLLLKYS